MSASRTANALTGGGAGNAYQAGDKWGYQTAEKVRQDLDIGLYSGTQISLGGSEWIGVVASSYETVPNYVEIILNGDTYGGMTLDAVVFYRTSNAATSVTVRIRDITSPATAATGSTSTSTTSTSETLSLTMLSGPQTYRLEIQGGNTTNPVFGWGYFRIRKVAV